jgi:stage II sporulation protein AA (anti-sigma F factor antagonist)
MKIVVEQINSVTVLYLRGKLNLEGCPVFDQTIATLPAGGKVLLDLAQLEYVASAGLRLFLLAAKSSARTKGRLILCSLTPNVAQIFKLAGFSTFLEIEADRAAALRKLAS